MCGPQQLADMVDLLRRGIDACKPGGRASAQDELTECPGTAAHIEPACALRRVDPGEKFLAHCAAPTPHEAFVVFGSIEGDFDFGHELPIAPV